MIGLALGSASIDGMDRVPELLKSPVKIFVGLATLLASTVI
jgi:hypothetical protein